MKLYSLQIKGFKCYEDSGEIPFHNLTIFIGENDAGKSTVLHALEVFFTNKHPEENYFRNGTDLIEISIVFKVDTPPEEIKDFVINKELKIKKIFKKGDFVKIEILKESFTNNKLNDYLNLKSEDLKTLLEELSLEPQSNNPARIQSVEKYIDENQVLIPKINNWSEINWTSVNKYLPIFQKYSSSDYGNPVALIKKTLDIVYRESFYEKDAEGKDVLLPHFKDLQEKIEKKLNKTIEEKLLEYIIKYTPEVREIKGNYSIDFAEGLTLDGLSIKDESNRLKPLNQIGDGSKKKLFLSILEWDKDISSKSVFCRSIIRGYDEPDASLHYNAQRKMFYALDGLANDPLQNIQAIICTHSLTMIDRAPAKCINHIMRDKITERSTIEHLDSNEDEDIEYFLSQISEISGIKNSSIFYEKCFFLVEGHTEAGALPILYKTYTGKTMSEDGVVLINLKTNGQWDNALKFLHARRKKCTVLMLDTDVQLSSSTNQVTIPKLQKSGFDPTFLSSNCFLIGTKEFEDVFTDVQLTAVCNEMFKKNNGSVWVENDFASIRSDKKFSNSLNRLLFEQYGSVGKPKLGASVARILTKEEIKSIDTLKKAFDKIVEIIS